MFWLKLKAGALQVTLGIVVIIALLLTGFVLLVHTHKQFQIQTDFIIETTKIADRGITYALKHQIPLNDTTTVDLRDEDYKTLKVKREFWGVFEKVSVTSQIKKSKFQKIGLIGAKQSENNRTALYLQDNNKPLVLVGDTKVEGLVYLPKRGAKPGTISGHSYYGSQLIYGQTRVSSDLPKVFSETTNQIESLEQLNLKFQEDQFLNIESGKYYSNSFFNPPQIVYSDRPILLQEVRLTGHIIIQSKSKIIVDASSKLTDVILISPKIEIQDHFSGTIQVIASEEVNIGKHVKLDYPSALVLNEKKVTNVLSKNLNQAKEENTITIQEHSTLQGIVLYLGTQKKNNFKPQIELGENTIVHGEVYCNQILELKGSVYGTVYTNNFVTNQSGSIYQNHIYNGTISINELPEEYIGLMFNDSESEVMKWLY